jgi:hypothetical protein
LFHCRLGGGDEVFVLAACSDHVGESPLLRS